MNQTFRMQDVILNRPHNRLGDTSLFVFFGWLRHNVFKWSVVGNRNDLSQAQRLLEGRLKKSISRPVVRTVEDYILHPERLVH